MSHPPVLLGEVLERVERRVIVKPDENYRFVGVRSFGAGCFDAGERAGAETRYRELLRVEADDFVYPKLMAWEGAFAVVPGDFAGYVVSPEFCTFRARPDLDIGFLGFLFKRPETWEQVAGASIGTNVRRRRLYPHDFLGCAMAIPELKEQRRISHQLRPVYERLRRVRDLSRTASALAAAIPAALAHRPDLSASVKTDLGWRRIELTDVLTTAGEETRVEHDGAYPNVGALSFGRGLFEKPPILGTSTSAAKLFRIRTGQFIYSRLFAFEGAYGVVPERFDGYYVSSEFPVFEVDGTRVETGFLEAYFRSPTLWSELARKSKGLGVRRQRVNQEALLRHPIWLPPLADQRSASSALHRVKQAEGLREVTLRLVGGLDGACLNRALSRAA